MQTPRAARPKLRRGRQGEPDIDDLTQLLDMPAAQPRARGSVALSVRTDGAVTRLRDLRQAGSLKVMFPRSAPETKQAVIVNTAGGVTGGDRFTLNATVEQDARLVLTTQAAERAYRAQPGAPGWIRNRLSVAGGGALDWLPQETILFEGSNLERDTRIDLDADARLLFVEPLIFGRRAMGETLTDLRFRDRVDIHRDGVPLFLDAAGFDGDAEAHLDRPHIAGGARAIALIVVVAPEAETHLAPLRAMLPATAGASLIGPDLLVARILAPDGFALRAALMPILRRLSGAPLPRPWMI
ncbi:urease accessory protein UreD [uncultured Jannaschia sp.]|uniref:urease accessory protein UreD n=1 Tax=uncultured Jannaschia sp. TaxID=293347 RepID=UPI002638CFAC|nr:urease accessory protein UreD [uncultured Jannaschia sp.]